MKCVPLWGSKINKADFFCEVIIYVVTCFGLAAIFRHRSNTAGRLRDGDILKDEVQIQLQQ